MHGILVLYTVGPSSAFWLICRFLSSGCLHSQSLEHPLRRFSPLWYLCRGWGCSTSFPHSSDIHESSYSQTKKLLRAKAASLQSSHVLLLPYSSLKFVCTYFITDQHKLHLFKVDNWMFKIRLCSGMVGSS